MSNLLITWQLLFYKISIFLLIHGQQFRASPQTGRYCRRQTAHAASLLQEHKFHFSSAPSSPVPPSVRCGSLASLARNDTCHGLTHRTPVDCVLRARLALCWYCVLSAEYWTMTEYKQSAALLLIFLISCYIFCALLIKEQFGKSDFKQFNILFEKQI